MLGLGAENALAQVAVERLEMIVLGAQRVLASASLGKSASSV